MSRFMALQDLAAAKELGADILTKTFPENVPPAWWEAFRNAGWTPLPVEPDAATVKAEATQAAEREARNAQIEEMSFARFKELRERGWQDGENIPD